MLTEEQKSQVISLMSSSSHKNPKNFSLYIPFSSYRIDSLDYLGMIHSIEEYLDISVPDSQLPTFKCGIDVINYLEGII